MGWGYGGVDVRCVTYTRTEELCRAAQEFWFVFCNENFVKMVYELWFCPRHFNVFHRNSDYGHTIWCFPRDQSRIDVRLIEQKGFTVYGQGGKEVVAGRLSYP